MKANTQEITRISLLAALSVIGGMIVIPIGPVPVTLQTLFVLLAGLLLSPRAAFFSQLLHLILMLLLRGAPIIMIPSFGFLFGFMAAATLIAWLKHHEHVKNYGVLVLIGTFVIYLVGTPYMAFILNIVLESGLSFPQVLSAGVILFLPGDFGKALIAILIVKRLKKTTLVAFSSKGK